MEYRKKGEISSLTGLRGLAAVLVIITHFPVWTSVVPLAARPAWIEQWSGTAGIGMAIFFTLSGYVIALSYSHWDWRARPAFNLTRLFFYRFARLYPAFFVFAVVNILRSPTLRDLSDPENQSYVISHFLLWQAWLPVKYQGALADADRFHVSWSLSTECALYLLFGIGAMVAAMLPGGRRKPLVLGVVFFVSVAVLLRAAWLMRHDIAPAGWNDAEWSRWLLYISPYAVSLQFGLGVVAYRISRRSLPTKLAKIASDLGAAGLIAVYLLISTAVLRDPFHHAMLASLATALLMIGALSDSIANRVLSGRAIVYIGTISYSLYLFHWLTPSIGFNGQSPVLDSAAAAYYALNFLVAFVFAIMLATGVYTLVEVPGRRAIRAAADRLLGIQRAAPVGSEQGAAAE
jgi:peptidoglycan/LPS O-acetylase OafA/YrhL